MAAAHDDMTTRDFMAAHVAAALMGRGVGFVGHVAAYAYEVADALLKERDKPKQEALNAQDPGR
jgi:3-methyladenine DNA glycosylase Tag